jgi:phosphate transport system substrate-binding protein
MQHKFSILFAVLVGFALVLSACAPAATVAPTTAPPATQPPVEVVAGTPVTIVITATPAPTKAAPTKLPAGSIQINGSGATFPDPIYKEWVYAYAYIDPSVAINYQAVGSGGGKKAIVDGTVDFAGSDSLLTDAEYTSGKDLQMYPTLAGAVVTIYNIEGLAATDPVLVLDGATLVGIYNGTIKKWSDPAIAKLNPDLSKKLPDKTITAAHRSDGSGTTEIFTKGLTALDPAWKAGGASAVEWPVDKAGNGIGGKGNAGVAAAVQNTPNSIGYVELSYAVANKITFASMINKAGKTVIANNASTQSAVDDFANAFSDKLTTTIVNGAGEKTWPIAGYTYLILHTTSMKDCTKAQKTLEFFTWALTDANASKRASDLGYSPLTAAVRKSVLAKFALVTCNGQPVVKP